jgi:hypothetical protein
VEVGREEGPTRTEPVTRVECRALCKKTNRFSLKAPNASVTMCGVCHNPSQVSYSYSILTYLPGTGLDLGFRA